MNVQFVRTSNSFLRQPLQAPAVFEKVVRALVVAPLLEVRQPLLRTLEALSIDVVVCSSVAQALEVLFRGTVDIVFCEERLPDGRYSDLVASGYAMKPRIVVTTHTGEWELYFEAVRNGAFDVIRYPWHQADVEMVVRRALRQVDSGQPADSMVKHPAET